MKVFQIRLKLFILKDIFTENIQSKISAFIDTAFGKNQELLNLHNTNKFKNYCFDGLYPIERKNVYKAGNIYALTIRTIDSELADFFNNDLKNHYDKEIKALTSEIRIIPKKHIEKVYSITPVILKDEGGYWRGNLTTEDFERRLKSNLVKKYNAFTDSKIDEDFELYSLLEFKNRKPIATKYKNIRILGDKISLNIAENEKAQELMYMALGTGILENNSRGYGFVNFRYL